MIEFTKERIEIIRSYIGEHETNMWINVTKEALDHIERLQQRIAELEQERRWIPVSEWQIKEDGYYVYVDAHNTINVSHFYVRKAKIDKGFVTMVIPTPLPQPPKEGE